MKAILLNADVLVGTMAFGLCLWSCGCATHHVPPTTVSAKVDPLFSKWNRPDSPGAAVVVVKDGAVIFQRGYGCANLSHGIPITPQTVFDAASVAKQFTGLAVAILVEQGKLSLDEDVRKHLPEVPNFGTPITIRHLIYHTSGLRDWFETLMLSGIAPSDVITMDTILAMVRRQRNLDFAPGEEHSYSNTGYNLLAAIIAKVTKQSFREWTDANLFQPLGMMRTHFCDNATEIVPARAAYYTSEVKGQLHEFVSQLAAPGSSSLLTTAEDMGRWLVNFGTAHVGGISAIQLMQQPGKVNAGKKVDYAFGLGLDSFHGMKCVYHTGSWAGDCAMLWLPEKRFGVAVFANAPETNPGRIAFDIANIYFGYPQPTKQPQALVEGPPARPTTPKPTSEQLLVYVGDYWSEELQTVYHVELRNGELMMGQRLNGWRRLLPKGPDRFQTESSSSFPVAPAVEFTRDPSSAVVGMNITGGRVRSLRFVRASMR
jgi:CubicO group peptidase (beta-lactamase class C family)